jgi:hypothetical protein
MATRLVLSLEPFKNRGRSICAKPPQGWGRCSRLRVPLAGGALVLFGLLLWRAWPFTVDDAFIAARYARRLAQGFGYTFNDGPPTDGVTGPLALLPMWGAVRLGADALSAAKLLGGLAGAWSVVRVVDRAGRSQLGRLTGPLTAALCLSSLPLAIWSVAGLETGLATLVATELALSVTARPRPFSWRAGVCAAAMVWLRPEMLFWGVALLVALTLRERRASLGAWALLLLSGVLIVAFRFFLFGHALPMSAAAKPPELRHGFSYVSSALARPENVVALVLIGGAFARLGLRSRIFALALCAHVLALVLAGGDWMPGFRLFAPVVPTLAWLLADALARLSMQRKQLAWAAAALLLMLRIAVLVREIPVARAAGFNRIAMGPVLARSVRGAKGPVAALDVGALGYFADVTILDLGGLTEPRIAHAPGGHLNKHVDSAWLHSRAPSLILLHSSDAPQVDAQGHLRWFRGYPVERRVLEMPWVVRDYRVREVITYAPDYHYVVLTLAMHGR